MTRTLLLGFLCLCFLASTAVWAQPSRFGDAGDNLGTWKWGSSSSHSGDDFEDEDYDGTTWEQMYADRLYEQELEKEEHPASFSLLSAPVKIWRFFWPKKEEDEFE